MADLNPSNPDGAALMQLADALGHMRDSLTDLSLLLKDFQFEMNDERRAEIAAQLPDLLEKVRKLTG